MSCCELQVELQTEELAIVVSNRCNRTILTLGHDFEAFRSFSHEIAMTHPYALILRQSMEQYCIFIVNMNISLAVFLIFCTFDLAAEFV